MNLEAYTKIPKLAEVVEANNIEIPRVIGYSSMESLNPMSEEEIKCKMKYWECMICEKLCSSVPFWNTNFGCFNYNSEKDLRKYYLVPKRIHEEGYPECVVYTDIRWDRIHGWKRKVLKFEIKKAKKRIQKQADMHNKYAGKKNVLCVHARIGGDNWDRFGGNDIINQPWFLDRVNDAFDETYCEIYVSIK